MQLPTHSPPVSPIRGSSSLLICLLTSSGSSLLNPQPQPLPGEPEVSFLCAPPPHLSIAMLRPRVEVQSSLTFQSVLSRVSARLMENEEKDTSISAILKGGNNHNPRVAPGLLPITLPFSQRSFLSGQPGALGREWSLMTKRDWGISGSELSQDGGL